MDDKEGRAGKVLYPWANIRPNCLTQSAGEQYAILLSSALGGKGIHGANTAPTGEVLCKSMFHLASDGYVGRIRWDPSEATKKSLGHDISDGFYTHHHYRGTTTTSGAILAFETGAWEPAVRTRARATSLLAAGIYAHGVSRRDAVAVVKKIAGDDVDEEAFESALLQASHLKREMTLVSKANHRLFSKGTLQSGIIWDDSNLSLGVQADTVAFDWGRVTAIARYIAEANIQCDEKFRRVARDFGVPYFVVKAAWAYVSGTDYQLHPDDFREVPEIDVTKFGIPSIAGAFLDHEQDIVQALTRLIDTHGSSNVEGAYRPYLELYNAAKSRRDRRLGKKRKRVDLERTRDLPVTEHVITPSNVVEVIKGSIRPWTYLLTAVATRIKTDSRLSAEVAHLDSIHRSSSDYIGSIDKLTPRLMSNGTWALARSIGEDVDRNNPLELIASVRINAQLSTVKMQLSRLKKSIFGYPSHLMADNIYSPTTCDMLRPFVQRLLDEFRDVAPVANVTQDSFISEEIHHVSEGFSILTENALMILPTIREVTARVYLKWSKELRRRSLPGSTERMAQFYYAGKALQLIGLSTCRQKSAEYVDGSDPYKSYVYICTAKYAKKTGMAVPNLRSIKYANATKITEDLDGSMELPFLITKMVSFVTIVFDSVVGDLMMGVAYMPSQDVMEDVIEEFPPPGSPGYDTCGMDEAQALVQLEALMKENESTALPGEENVRRVVLDSYTSAQMAEDYARASGYDSFDAAYSALGIGAVYDPHSLYIVKAGVELAKLGPKEVGIKGRA